ncbi:hypothetical protein ACLMJK_004743 [Lecanora helva]
MAGTLWRKLKRGSRKMVRKTKTYGKKGVQNLTAGFEKISLSPAKTGEEDRQPLLSTSGNAAPLSKKAAGKKPVYDDEPRAQVTPSPDSTNPYPARAPLDPNDPLTPLLSLECVEPVVQDFQTFYQYLSDNLNIRKIAQGSYATVFRMAVIDKDEEYTIWKLMAIKPRKGKGSRKPDQTFIDDAANEVKSLAYMQQIPGFVDFRLARVLKGSLPQELITINEKWEQDHPDDACESEFGPDQQWLLIEMSDAGTDLEVVVKKGFPDGSLLHKKEDGARLQIEQTWDIFWAVSEALARAETHAQFEHRDLHPGNICIVNKSTRSTSDEDFCEIERHTNLQVTIIDYTLSRATINDEVLANLMRDPALFTQTSRDVTDRRQYEMYRKMREVVVGYELPSKKNMENWKEFVPLTNAFWLYHLLQLLLEETEEWETDTKDGKELDDLGDRKDRKLLRQLMRVLSHLHPDDPKRWGYLSATEVVDDHMGRLRKRPFDSFREGESEAMQEQRKARADKIEKEMEELIDRM